MRREGLAIKILVYLTFVIVLVGVLFCVGYRARHFVDDSSYAQGNHGQAEQPVSVQESHAQPRREQTSEDQGYAAKWFEPITILTFLLVVGVVVTACIYYGQLKKMRETVVVATTQGKTLEGQLATMQDQAKSVNATLFQTKKQLDIEIAKTNPRLRIAQVRAENFEVGKIPIFIVELTNDGLIDAHDVRFGMSVEMGDDKTLTLKDDTPFTVPAKETEIQFIVSPSRLTQQEFDGFNNAVPLRVKGYFSHWIDGGTEFCYKYHSWKGEREPMGMPQFIRCERKVTLDIGLRFQGIEMMITDGIPRVVIQPAVPENAPPESESRNPN